jgi:FAD:protein FMN transferase
LTITLAHPVRGAVAAMGTRFEVVLASEDVQLVQPVLEEALREIEDLHARFTRFSRSSLIAHINRTAARSPVRLDRSTFALFRCAEDVRILSQGAFDITIGTGAIVLDETDCSIALENTDVTLDLGAIAKGYALDRAAQILREGGVTSALIHGGTSSVLAIGAPPEAPAWRVGLARGHRLPFIDLCDAALSVSRPFSQIRDGKTHIVDPRSQAGIAERRFAVVIGPSACAADAWSTALAVLGERPASLSEEWTTIIETEHE